MAAWRQSPFEFHGRYYSTPEPLPVLPERRPQVHLAHELREEPDLDEDGPDDEPPDRRGHGGRPAVGHRRLDHQPGAPRRLLHEFNSEDRYKDPGKDGWVVDDYRDDALGVMARNADGQVAVTTVTLRPAVRFSGAQPTTQQHDELHHHAHAQCYIANSVKSEVRCEPALIA